MIDEPVPTMPEMVPATSPTARTKRKLKGTVSAKSTGAEIVIASVAKQSIRQQESKSGLLRRARNDEEKMPLTQHDRSRWAILSIYRQDEFVEAIQADATSPVPFAEIFPFSFDANH